PGSRRTARRGGRPQGILAATARSEKGQSPHDGKESTRSHQVPPCSGKERDRDRTSNCRNGPPFVYHFRRFARAFAFVLGFGDGRALAVTWMSSARRSWSSRSSAPTSSDGFAPG